MTLYTTHYQIMRKEVKLICTEGSEDLRRDHSDTMAYNICAGQLLEALKMDVTQYADKLFIVSTPGYPEAPLHKMARMITKFHEMWDYVSLDDALQLAISALEETGLWELYCKTNISNPMTHEDWDILFPRVRQENTQLHGKELMGKVDELYTAMTYFKQAYDRSRISIEPVMPTRLWLNVLHMYIERIPHRLTSTQGTLMADNLQDRDLFKEFIRELQEAAGTWFYTHDILQILNTYIPDWPEEYITEDLHAKYAAYTLYIAWEICGVYPLRNPFAPDRKSETISQLRAYPAKELQGHHDGKEANSDMPIALWWARLKSWDLFAKWDEDIDNVALCDYLLKALTAKEPPAQKAKLKRGKA